MTTALEKQPDREGGLTGTERTRSRRGYQPRVDILELPAELTLLADMPGVESDGVDIQFEKGVISIFGKVKDRQPESTRYFWNEYGVGDYYRTFQVSEVIDGSRISAEYSDGVLTLHLPKVEAAQPRKIEVQTK